MTLHTLHFRLYTLHSTLCTLHFTGYSPHSKLHTLLSTLHTLHFTLYSLHSTIQTPHFTLHTPHCTLDTPHFTLHTLNFTLYTLLSTLHTPHFTFHHSPHFTFHHSPHRNLHSTLYTPHLTLHTLHSTLYTFHFTIPTPHSTHITFPTQHPTFFTLQTLHSTPFHIPQSTAHWCGNRGKSTQLFKSCFTKCFTWLHSGSWALLFKNFFYLNNTMCMHTNQYISYQYMNVIIGRYIWDHMAAPSSLSQSTKPRHWTQRWAQEIRNQPAVLHWTFTLVWTVQFSRSPRTEAVKHPLNLLVVFGSQSQVYLGFTKSHLETS